MTAATRPSPVLRVAGALGLLGSSILGLGCLLAALPYRGRIGEPYSPVNHFVSELGEVGVNPGAAYFNGGLIVGGLLLAGYMAGLGWLDGRRLTRATAVVGTASAVAVAGVGLVPMNHLMPHLAVAGVFFHGGLLTIILFSLSLRRSARMPGWLLWVGLPSLVAYVVLLTSIPVGLGGVDIHDLPLDERRPDLWLPPLVEWVVVLGTLGWVAVVSVLLLRGRGAERP